MSIDSVSDVFAFACNHPDYWDMLVGEDDIPELDTEDRKEAFAAAREHVLASVEALLRTCLKAVQTLVPEGDRGRYLYLPRQGVNSGPTRRNCYVATKFMEGRGKESWMNISLEPDWSGAKIRLYATIQSNMENIRAFQAAMPTNPPATEAEGNYYYFGDLEIREGDSLSGLAERLAEVAWPGVVKFAELVSPSAKA